MKKSFSVSVLALVCSVAALTVAGCGPETREVAAPTTTTTQPNNFKSAIQDNPSVPQSVKDKFAGHH